jgi:hypothetical protein
LFGSMPWMVVFGCGACVKGQSIATRRDGMVVQTMPPLTMVSVKIRSFRSATPARERACSCTLEALWYLAPALREPGHDLLVQPDIHVGGAVELAFVAKLLR